MCRAQANGGRRCNKHNPYGQRMRNLQAKKQYHANLLTEDLSIEQRQRHAHRLTNTVGAMDALRAERDRLGTVQPHVMQLTPATEQILGTLRAAGYAPYIVGGSVRDALMGHTPKDVDIEVYGGSGDDIAQALTSLGRVDEVGKAFGVLKISINGEEFDVSLPRRDSKTGDHHRDFTVEVDPELSLEEATARRDYTINALMYDHKLGFVIDKHGGLQDMADGYLRHVSDAFDEDPLRVLRGVQMAARFNMQLHPDTLAKAETLRDQYASLATERVQMEFQKLYTKGTHLGNALTALRDTGWDRLFPGLPEADQTELHVTAARVEHMLASGSIPKASREKILAAAIASHLPEAARSVFLSKTTVGDDTARGANALTITQIPDATDDAELRHWVRDMQRNMNVAEWAAFKATRGQTQQVAPVLARLQQLGIEDGPERDLITGEDLLARFPARRPGPWVRQALDAARDAQYNDIFRDHAAGLLWLENNPPTN